MKIGIVSAPKHCKTHIRSLRKEGYNIHCLGDDPKGIPPSYDVVVVRVASSSHQGVAVARDWSRKTGKPSLYENGLSGIRTAIKDLAPFAKNTEGPPSPELTLESARLLVRQWGEALYESRPQETAETMQKHLKATLRREHPTQYSLWAPLIPMVCVDITGETSLSSPPVTDASRGFVAPHPSTERDAPMTSYPTAPSPSAWGRVYTPAKIGRGVDSARAILNDLEEDLVDSFRQAYLRCEANPSLDLWKWASRQPRYLKRGAKRTIFCGKPVVYVAFVYLLFAEETPLPRRLKRTFYTSYKSLTGKGADTRLPDAMAWYLGFPAPEESLAYHKAMDSRTKKPVSTKKPCALQVEGKTANTKKVTKEVGGGPTAYPPLTARGVADVEENTRALCSLMDDVKTLRDQSGLRETGVDSRITALGSKLDEAIKTGFDPHTNHKLAQMIRSSRAWDFAQMKEDLREDISNAFDALAAEQPSGDLSSNPFAALEQVKAALKAAGFKGTLTLTIE